MASPQSSSEKPALFVLNLDNEQMYEGLFDTMYSGLIDRLAPKFRIQRARKADPAKRYLSNLGQNKPVAILVADPGVVHGGHEEVLALVKNYVKTGGIAIMGCLFSSFIRPDEMVNFWKGWGKNWEMGDYHRTDVYVTSNIHGINTATLQPTYSQKALFLAHVSSGDALYSPNSQSRTQSRVFPPRSVSTEQAPVVLSKVGEGLVGYLGDVNNEYGSQMAIVAMLDLAVSRSQTRNANIEEIE